jgi:hypothetical protein
MRAGVTTLVLVTGVLLIGCTGLKSSAAVVSQGSTNATLVKPNNAKTAKLADLHGTVEVKTGNGQWTQAQSGQTLKSGQQIRTGALSNVSLAFYDGSSMELGAEVEIALNALDAGTSGARVVQLTQVSGESQHEVVMSEDPGSHYDVNTPAGNGSTNNSKFTVMVFPSQLSQFWVEAGDVSVVNETTKVAVGAGQTTSIIVGEPPIDPESRITGQGQVMQIGMGDSASAIIPASTLNVSENQNGKITLCHATGSTTNPYVEITVSVAGATNGHAKHPGDIIPAPADGCPTSSPTTSSTPTSWNIAGQTFQPGASMVIFGNPQPGDWVSFEGRQLADGTRFADRIVLLDHSPKDQLTFIGKVESIADTAWTISNHVVQVNDFTTIDAGLKVGDNAQVLGGIVEDGTFLAKNLSQTDGADTNFRFSGVITNISNDVWDVSGIKVTVDKNTTRYGDFVLGNPLEVEGVIKEDGTWLAKTINLVTPEGYHFDYTGVVQSLSPWIVSGISFDTADWTEIDASIKVGDKVLTAGVINPNGIWVAETIELLDTAHPTSFAFFGPVISINPWIVRGVPLTVDGNTIIKNVITVGEMVKVTGRILEDGSWLATDIKHTGLHLGQGCFLVTGVVQSINGDQIFLVDGQTLVKTGDLAVTGDLKEGSMVRYQFCVDVQGQSKLVSITVISQMEGLPQAKAVICHYPPGNPGNRHTIEVGQPAVPAHLAHGDTLGLCPSENIGKQPNKNK